jgi:type IV secretion system protein VirB10
LTGRGASVADSGASVREPNSSSDTDHKSAFLNAGADHQVASLERLQGPASPYSLQAGGVIAAALLTGLRSDLPTAHVTVDVYDSPTGRFLLIPQGSRLIGQYDAQIAFGQSRALLAWTRLILPDGRSVALERQPVADSQGYAGLEDKVDNHWGQLFKAATLSPILSVGADTGTSANDSGLVSALRQGASDSISQVGRSLTVQPTITIRPGFPVRVIVTRDLVFR